ncbi:MAG: SseB family protein [Paracoccaceae bacterium]
MSQTTVETALDRAHRAMSMAPDDDAARLNWYHVFADSELCLLLEKEAEGVELSPAIFELSEGRFAMVFDQEERLASFAEDVVPYAALPGRVIAANLAGRDIGICVNLDVAPSAFVMPAGAVDWLAGALSQTPAPASGPLGGWTAPQNPELGRALWAKLIGQPLPVRAVWLTGVRLEGDQATHAFVFVDADRSYEGPLARAANEAVLFSGHDPEGVSILFLSAEQAAGLEGIALPVWAPPEPTIAPEPAAAPAAPGSDPDRPPRLR